MKIANKLANSFEGPDFNMGTLNDLIDKTRDELSNSVIYFFVTAYNMEKFAPYLAHSLKLNYDRLKQYGADLQVRLKCDGRVEDFQSFSKAFDEEQFPRSNIEITKNDQNEDCAPTRLKQLLEARGEIEESIRLGKNTWISIFDGDDMLHQYSLLLRLVVGLHTGSDAVTMMRFFARCGESQEDLDEVSSLLTRSIDTESFLTKKACGISDYTDNLLNARNLYANAGSPGQHPLDEISQEQEQGSLDLSTLMPLSSYYHDVTELFSESTRNNPQKVLHAPFVADILSGKHQPSYTPLLFYVQQSKSLEHSQLELFLKRYWSNDRNFRKYLKKCINNSFFYDIDDTRLLFGASNKISDKFLVTPEKNTAMDRRKLLEAFRYNHRLAKEMVKFLNEEIAKEWNPPSFALEEKWSAMSEEKKRKKIERAENLLKAVDRERIIPEQDLFELFKSVNTENVPASEEQALFKVFKVFSKNSLVCRQLAEFLNETKIKELLNQDVSQPLSDEVMEQIFGEVFDTILAGKGSN